MGLTWQRKPALDEPSPRATAFLGVPLRRAHEGLQSLELVAQRRICGELDLVAGDRQRFDRGWPSQRGREPGGPSRGPREGGRGRLQSRPVGEMLASCIRGCTRAGAQGGARRLGNVLVYQWFGAIHCVWTQWTALQCRLGGAGLRQLAHGRRSIGPGRQLGDQRLDLLLGPVCGPLQQSDPVLRREERRQECDSAQVKPALAQHGEENGVLASRASDADAEDRLRLREVKDLRAVREGRGRGLSGVELPRVDLADQEDEVGLDPAGLAEGLGQMTEYLGIGQRRL